MNPILDRIYAEGVVEGENGETLPIDPVAVKYNEGMALYQVIRHWNTSKTLEIGMAYGVATLFMAQAHRDAGSGLHTVFDPYQSTQWHSIGRLNLARADLDGLTRFIEGPSHVVLPALLAAGETFDFVFVDGAHLFDYVMLDLFYVDQLLTLGGYLMIHDLVVPSVRKALSFALRNYAYETVIEPGRAPVSASKPWTRMASVFLQSPWEAHVWSLPFKARQPDLFARNYALLRKTGSPDRVWDHYRAF